MSSDRRKPYPFDQIEPKWQAIWDQHQIFHAPNPGEKGFDPAKPKFYVLDMFPYPSGAGLHVGHPEGYTATDIVARYKRLRGFNVLHPMGWDAFGLPAEQYAVKTGQHPAITTRENVAKFKSQLKRIGFSYDWQREINTTDPRYYRWTQWIFLQIYNSWFDPERREARPISELREKMKSWMGYAHWSDAVREKVVNDRRLAYVDEVPVWFCPQLGTVLAAEEILDGKSEVGGFPVVRRAMRQWLLRITEYADRLIDDLDELEWPQAIKTHQRNWIGRTDGAIIEFTHEYADSAGTLMELAINVFSTRPDTIFGATYLVLAPEHPFVDVVTNRSQREAVAAYRSEALSKSELERTNLSKSKTGVFTGGYAVNPANQQRIPIWVADYVVMKRAREQNPQRPEQESQPLGAVMGVPAHDERDWEFTSLVLLDPHAIRLVVESPSQRFCNFKPIHLSADMMDLVYGTLSSAAIRPAPNNAGVWIDFASHEMAEQFFATHAVDFGSIVPAPTATDGVATNSTSTAVSLDKLSSRAAKERIIDFLEHAGVGRRHRNYKLDDWLFSRQRYWGEPFPIVWENEKHRALNESKLPVLPPPLEDYKPTGTGEPPLAKAKDWVRYSDKARRELNVMPQWAGSCWYYLRFADPQNDTRFVGEKAERYWDYGAEVLDFPDVLRGREFFDAAKVYFLNKPGRARPGMVDLYVGGTEHAVLHLLYARFWHKVLFDLGYLSKPEPFQRLVNQGIILGEDNQKMSKSRGNIVSPDDVIDQHGADAFRCYEMFMGPLEQMKPWSTHGVEGVARFLTRVWRLLMTENQAGEWELSQKIKAIDATKPQQKLLHATIKKVTEDIDSFSFNTAISQMMIFVNGFTNADAIPLSVMRTFLVLLNPFAPHISSELWERLRAEFGDAREDVTHESWPAYDERLLIEDEVEIVIQINGKLRDRVKMPILATEEELKAVALSNPKVQDRIAGKTVRKVIVVPKKLVNIVVT